MRKNQIRIVIFGCCPIVCLCLCMSSLPWCKWCWSTHVTWKLKGSEGKKIHRQKFQQHVFSYKIYEYKNHDMDEKNIYPFSALKQDSEIPFLLLFCCWLNRLSAFQACVFISVRSEAGVKPSPEDHERAGAVAAGGRAAAQSDPSESGHYVYINPFIQNPPG